MTHHDLKQLARSLILQARMLKTQGDAELAESLVRRGATIRAIASSLAPAEPALIPVRAAHR